MSLISNSAELVDLFSHERITHDLNEQLFAALSAGKSAFVELDEGKTFEIPPMCRHEVCAVVLQCDLVSPSVHVRVFCAVGGIKAESCGVIESNICFALLKYDQDGVLFTYDLYSSQFY